MKKLLLLTVILALFLIQGCDKANKGIVRVHNRTSYNVYATLQNQSYTIPGNTTMNISVKTDDKSMVQSPVALDKRAIELILFGETFQMIDENDLFTDHTIIHVNDDDTYQIYCDPNRAAVKVINNASLAVTKVQIFKHIIEPEQDILYASILDTISQGENRFQQLDPATGTPATFYYVFKVTLADGSILSYGDFETSALREDQEFVINLQPAVKHHK